MVISSWRTLFCPTLHDGGTKRYITKKKKCDDVIPRLVAPIPESELKTLWESGLVLFFLPSLLWKKHDRSCQPVRCAAILGYSSVTRTVCHFVWFGLV